MDAVETERRPKTLERRRCSVATGALSVASPRVQVYALHRRPRETRRIGRRRQSRSRISRRRCETHRYEFGHSSEIWFRDSLSRKALDVQQGRFVDWRLLTVKNADCSRRSSFRSRAWHARRPPVDLKERSHHGACLIATLDDPSRPWPVARIGRGPELPTENASRLVRGFTTAWRETRDARRGRRATVDDRHAWSNALVDRDARAAPTDMRARSPSFARRRCP